MQTELLKQTNKYSQVGFSSYCVKHITDPFAIIKEFSITMLQSMKGLYIQFDKNDTCNDQEIPDNNTDLIIQHLACPLVTFNSLVMVQMGQSMLQTS